MAIDRVKFPNGNTENIQDSRIPGVDSTPTANSANLVTSGGVYSSVSSKQDALVSGTNIKTINSQSLLGSGDIAINTDTSDCEKIVNKVTAVTSSSADTEYPSAKSVYDSVHPETGASQPAGGMLSNRHYKLGTLSGSVTFSLATPDDADIDNYYFWSFSTGSTAPTIVWPSSVTSWYDGSAPTINPSKYYEVIMIDGVGSCKEI